MTRGNGKVVRRRAKRDAVVAAVLKSLPTEGALWERKARVAWLRMLNMSFNVAYGDDGGISVEACADRDSDVYLSGPAGGGMRDSAPSNEKVAAMNGQHVVEAVYHIDPDGFAMHGITTVDPEEIPAGTVIADRRQGNERYDWASILWKTGGVRGVETLPNKGLRLDAPTG